MSILGDNLRKLRNKDGLTQAEISAALGVPHPTYASWERGRTEPSISWLKKLANYHNKTVDDLLSSEPRVLRIGSWYPLGRGARFHPMYRSGIYTLIYPLLYNRLFFFDIYERRFHMELIESWNTNKEDLSYTFYLRKDVYFHDGNFLTLQDVKYSYRLFIERYKFYDQFIEDFERDFEILEGDHAIRLKLRKWLELEYLPDPYIIPEDSSNDECFNGTGPWLIRDEEQRERIREGLEQPVTLESNERYFGKKASIQQVEFYRFDDLVKLKNSLRKGEVDLVYDFAPPDALEGFEIQHDHSTTSFYLVLKPDIEMFQEDKSINIRKAIALAINRKEIVDSIGEKKARLLPDDLLYIILHERSSSGGEGRYDKSKAEAFWRKVVNKNGIKDFVLKISCSTVDPVKMGFAKIVIDQLKRVGINAEYEPDLQEAHALVQEIGFHRPRTVYLHLHSTESSGRLWYYKDDYVDKLLDNVEGMDTYRALQEYLKTKHFFIPLFRCLVAVTYTEDLDTRSRLQGDDTLYGHNMVYWKFKS